VYSVPIKKTDEDTNNKHYEIIYKKNYSGPVLCADKLNTTENLSNYHFTINLAVNLMTISFCYFMSQC